MDDVHKAEGDISAVPVEADDAVELIEVLHCTALYSTILYYTDMIISYISYISYMYVYVYIYVSTHSLAIFCHDILHNTILYSTILYYIDIYIVHIVCIYVYVCIYMSTHNLTICTVLHGTACKVLHCAHSLLLTHSLTSTHENSLTHSLTHSLASTHSLYSFTHALTQHAQ